MRFRAGREAHIAGPTTMENLFRMNGAGAGRSMRPGSHQMIENVDPYVRCQSRHFQNPSNLRSGAVISTIGGLRVSIDCVCVCFWF